MLQSKKSSRESVEAVENSRKHCAVVSHDDLVQNWTHHTAVHLDLFGSRSEHLRRTHHTGELQVGVSAAGAVAV